MDWCDSLDAEYDPPPFEQSRASRLTTCSNWKGRRPTDASEQKPSQSSNPRERQRVSGSARSMRLPTGPWPTSSVPRSPSGSCSGATAGTGSPGPRRLILPGAPADYGQYDGRSLRSFVGNSSLLSLLVATAGGYRRIKFSLHLEHSYRGRPCPVDKGVGVRLIRAPTPSFP